MTVAQLVAWMNLLQVAIPAGIGTVETITGWIKAAHGTQMTDAQMNVALGIIFDDATRRKALAIADALGPPPPAPSV